MPASSASLVCGVAEGDIDPVHLVQIALSFAQYCAMVPLQVDPRHRKRIVLGVAAETERHLITDRDPGWQVDVLISVARRGDKPIATFSQYSEASGVTASTSPAAALPKPKTMIEMAAIHTR